MVRVGLQVEILLSRVGLGSQWVGPNLLVKLQQILYLFSYEVSKALGTIINMNGERGFQ